MLQIYLRKEPRAIVLVCSSQDGDIRRQGSALVLSAHDPTDGNGGQASSRSARAGARAVIELASTDEIDIDGLHRLHDRSFGCLGLINVGADLFLGVIIGASIVGEVKPGETALKVTSVAFHCLNKSLWDENGVVTYGGPLDPQGPKPLPHEAGYLPPPNAGNGGIVEHPCASMKRLLGNGTFYFAKDGSFDLSQSLQQRFKRSPRSGGGHGEAKLISPQTEEPPELDFSAIEDAPEGSTDSRFVWNTYMMEPLHEYRSRLDVGERITLDKGNFLILLIQGYVGVAQTGDSSVALISRLSWKRAGTRYATRGIDDDGNVANFAESETLYTCDRATISFLQVRGSVPLFWEQQGLQAFNARIQVTRSRIASQPAFDRHFVDLLQHYDHVHALNLLGQRDAEVVLTNAYAEHMRNSEAAEMYDASMSKGDQIASLDKAGIDRMGLTNFDFHNIARLNGGLDAVSSDLRRLAAIRSKREAFAYTLVTREGDMLEQQQGVFRVNCLDCLDRTNVVQGVLSQDGLQMGITAQHLRDPGNSLWSQHRGLWAENGDALSRIYAGTGALNSDFTRTGVGKKTLGGLLSDAAKSASRLYINNFQDKSKQNVIDALLGNMAEQRAVSVFDPIHDAVNAELDDRLDEFSSTRDVTIFSGTWNLAGRSPSGESLAPFLFATDSEPDIFAIGLQEVVPLTPQQILLTDPEQLRYWERTIADTFERRSGKRSRYIPLRSEQLVGTALLVYVKESLLPHVRQVEAATKKTGLKGMSGNKGGAAIRLNVYDTSFCFVTAHFAAGKSNVEERNADFHTISRNLLFHGGRGVNNCHHTIWLGDFNYRIDGGNEVVRPLCERNDLDELAARDQLIRAKEAGQVFDRYTEGMLTFLPTYKYDFNSQTYDTGEKFRVPAWTDRILYKSRYPFRSAQLIYDRAELLTSDHRPVYAMFEADARQYDKDKRNALRRQLLVKYKAKQVSGLHGIVSSNVYHSSDDALSTPPNELAEDYDTDELPMPSSDDGPCWWNEALSSEDGSDEDERGSDSSREESRQEGNPFDRRRRRRLRSSAQYANPMAPPRSSRPTKSPGGGASRSFIPSPLALSVEVTQSPSEVTPTSGSKTKSADAEQQQLRRAAPPPPRHRSSTTALETAESKPAGLPTSKRAKPPPAVPLKPVRLGQAAKPSIDSRSIAEMAGRDLLDSQAPIQPPKIPARPTLGSRSQSYQSAKSQKSLLDGSD